MMAEKPDVNLVEPGLEEKSVRREWLRMAGTASAGAILFLLTGNTKQLCAQ